MNKPRQLFTNITFLTFALMVFVFSCKYKQKEDKNDSKLIKTESNQYGEPNESIGAPIVVFIDESKIKKITAQAPEIKNLPTVSHNTDGSVSSDQSASGIGLFTNYDSDNGLALDGVGYCKTILCDKNGNLWFSKYGGGVSKYDGKFFSTYTTTQGLANNSVTSIVEDKKGNLWFGSFGGGVSKYDGKSFSTYTTTQGLANNTVFCMVEDKKGNLWFGTNGGGVSRLNEDGKSFVTYTVAQGLANDNVRSIAEDKKGNLWFGTDGGVSKYDGKSFSTYTIAQGLANNGVFSIAEDKNGNLWFGTTGCILSKYDGKLFRTYSIAKGLANETVVIITEDKSGNLWFGTDGGGVFRLDPNGKSFSNFTTAQGLSNNNVWTIAEDKSGNLWFGTGGGGLSKYNGNSFITFTTAHGLANNSVFSIAEDISGNLWFGTKGGGVSRLGRDGKFFSTYTTDQGLANNDVRSIAEDKNGNLWFGTNGGGVSRLGRDGKFFSTYTIAQGLANNDVRSIAEDKNGSLWFGTNGGGVSRLGRDGKSFSTYTTAQGLANNIVRSIVEDKSGNLWFGTDGGVSKYDGKSFSTYTTAQGLADNYVNSIAEDKNGNLWFGTEDGLSVMFAENETLQKKEENIRGTDVKIQKMFLNFTKKQGLPDNTIAVVREDKMGNLVLGTNFGLCVIPAKEVARISTQGANKNFSGLEIYNQFTGYPVRDVNYGTNNGAMLVDSRDMVWVGHGVNGITRINFDAVHKNNNLPTVIIQAVKVNESTIDWYNLDKHPVDSSTSVQQEIFTYGSLLEDKTRDSIRKKYADIQFDGITRFYALPLHLVLPYRHNSITFDFVAIETGRNFMVRYQYMLDGYDKEWSSVTDKTSATFGNMNEGTYTFKLKARSPEGVWSEPVTYSFKVLPPWWRTWWMYVVYSILAFGLVTLIVWWNGRRLRARAKVLEQEIDKATQAIKLEKKKSDDLLLNILPEEVAEELKETGQTHAKRFYNVTVLFTDFVNFTGISQKMNPTELVAEIHKNFSAFDNIIENHGLEKIKTIGDAYMAVCGLPNETPDHAQRTINAALEIRDYISQSKGLFQIRIGVNSGEVVAGIVGVKKYAYDIWGDTVNTANRIESKSEPGKVNISGSTYALVKDYFNCESRGKITVKGKGEIEMYFVEYQ